ncbi:DUF6512 family protein [Anaerosalibacter bizertensis]|uniref:DUF6512 family protein n=1 Tax=Anaerosalibacter bizertensis TaxID=932217 RepID=UPI0035135447
MYIKDKKIFKWEVAGVFWIIIVGFLLHFVYEWSNSSPIVGIFSPINESVWEHLKLGYWSTILFMLIEYWFLRRYVSGFFLGKALGIITLELTILIIFYSYTAITKEPILWIDIGSYIVGAILCQLVSYRIFKKPISEKSEKLGLAILIIFGIILGLFTFYPPDLPIFKDPTKS